MQITAELCWGGSQNVSIWTPLVLICAGQMPAQNGGSRAMAATSDCHAAQLALSEPARNILFCTHTPTTPDAPRFSYSCDVKTIT